MDASIGLALPATFAVFGHIHPLGDEPPCCGSRLVRMRQRHVLMQVEEWSRSQNESTTEKSPGEEGPKAQRP
jgi:hypothetical protein